jgi:hypothetical protein
MGGIRRFSPGALAGDLVQGASADRASGADLEVFYACSDLLL